MSSQQTLEFTMVHLEKLQLFTPHPFAPSWKGGFSMAPNAPVLSFILFITWFVGVSAQILAQNPFVSF